MTRKVNNKKDWTPVKRRGNLGFLLCLLAGLWAVSCGLHLGFRVKERLDVVKLYLVKGGSLVGTGKWEVKTVYYHFG